jgi:hypothetical protein
MDLTLSGQRLPQLGVLAARGPDARRFLQGQLSQDVLPLTPDRVRLAGYHNAQGRAIAVLWLLAEGPQDVLCITTRALVPALIERLRRFVLRAKVTLADESALAPLSGWMGRDAESALGGLGLHFASAQPGCVARSPGLPVQAGSFVAWRHPGGSRFLVLNAAPDTLPAADARNDHDWRAADIAAGLPRLEPATSESFVAQMLNLDVLEGISFQKGCYTGQEVIARAHYRGRVKRRMQRFRTLAPITAEWPAGLHGTFTDGRTFQVIDALRQADGRCEFLAVTALAGPTEPGAPADASDTAASADAAESSAVESLPLPYALPD